MFAFIAALHVTGFWRCGKHFPQKGLLVDLAEFSKKQIARLENEPMLRVTEPTEEQLQAAKSGDTEGEAELRFDLAEVMRSLAVEDFQKDGKPRMDVLKTLMPDAKFNAALRDEVWDAVVDDGFVAPSAEE
ncbi:hypothetical protein [Profundibacter sp.]